MPGTSTQLYSKLEVHATHQNTILPCLDYRTGVVLDVGTHNGKTITFDIGFFGQKFLAWIFGHLLKMPFAGLGDAQSLG